MDAQWLILIFLLVSLLATYRVKVTPAAVPVRDRHRPF